MAAATPLVEGDNIPLECQGSWAVADSYDAMTSKRVYRGKRVRQKKRWLN